MQKVFAIFDVKSAQYLNPVFMLTPGEAIRAFSDLLANGNNPIAQHPEDYSMHELGTWDPSTGKLESLPAKKHLAEAVAVIQQLKSARAPEVQQAKPAHDETKKEAQLEAAFQEKGDK